MDLSTLLLALPIFFLAYQGIGLILEARENQKWGIAKSPHQAAQRTALSREFSSLSAKLGFNRTLLRYKKLSDRLDLMLLRSGYPFGWKAEDLLLCKELTVLFAMLILWRVGMTGTMGYVMGAVLGFWLPDFYMQAKVSERQSEIRRKLPGFIDLLALTMESGLDLLAAVERILEKMRPNTLREELTSLLQETRLGTPRKEALQHLAFRVNLPDIQSLTSIIIQSEELGTSLSGVLRNYAEDMRTRRILFAEEVAGKMPVKMLFPMMVFFFPIVFVIIFGPLAVNFMSSYK